MLLDAFFDPLADLVMIAAGIEAIIAIAWVRSYARRCEQRSANA